MKKICKLVCNNEGKITHKLEPYKDQSYVPSFASTYDDVLVFNMLKGKKKGFYIDIGAFDPNSGSNTKLFYDQGWSGINIEPNAKFFLKLARSRPRDINLNYAVSNCGNKDIPFYMTCNSSWGDKANEQSTIVSEVASYRESISINSEYKEVYNLEALGKEWTNYMERLEEKGDQRHLEEIRVPVLSLKQLCDQFCRNQEIDYLSIDVEGAEHLVLDSGDFNIYRPRIIECEDNKPYMDRKSITDILKAYNYTLVFEDAIGVNKYYVRNEDLKNINTSLDLCFLYPLDWFIREGEFDSVIYCHHDLPNHFEFCSTDRDFKKAIIVGFSEERGDRITIKENSLENIEKTEDGITLRLMGGQQILFYDVYKLDLKNAS